MLKKDNKPAKVSKVVEAPKDPEVLNLDNLFDDMINKAGFVNSVKAERAVRAAFNKAKPDTNEVVLAAKIRAKDSSISKDKLIVEIYLGLGGLIDLGKAKINRINEAKERKRKRK